MLEVPGKKHRHVKADHATAVPSACGPSVLTPLFPACGLPLTQP